MKEKYLLDEDEYNVFGEDFCGHPYSRIDLETEKLNVRSPEFRQVLVNICTTYTFDNDALRQMVDDRDDFNAVELPEGANPEGIADFILEAAKDSDDGTFKSRVCILVNDYFEEHGFIHDVVSLKDEAVARKAEEMARLLREKQNTLAPRLEAGKLQVIVKAADIVLTPEKPVYPGGTWHLEGMQHENIVCTGIFYYQQCNVTPSHLEFRQAIDDTEFEYPQSEHDHIYLRYRAENGDQKNSWLGEVSTPEGRCIVFPNDLQHRAQPFQLVDHTKPGVRKMLVFFVVDPANPILATDQVPRQQGIMSHEEALKNRELLMEARRNYVVAQNEEYEEEISLCEH
eukprot:Sspe_Gene.1976::Locus_669_Transcript_1_1_Confidence_1.000_Length_2220::g.1976::m.1976